VVQTNAATALPDNTLPRQRRVGQRARTTSLYRDPFRLCLVLLIIVTMSKFGGYFALLRLIRPALLLFAISVIYALLHSKKLILSNFRNSVTVRLLCAIGLVAVCSVPFGISLGRAATFFLDNFSKTLAITFLMIATVRDLSDLRRLTWAFTFAGILLAFLSIFVVGISKVTGGVSYDANDVGVFMVMTLPLTILFVQSAASKQERLLALTGVALLAATLVKTQSRGAFIGAVVVFAALLLVPGVNASRRLFFVAAATVTMLVAAPSGYWASMQSILSDPKADYNWDAVNGRRNIARRGIQYMRMYPVFGVGINNFAMAEGTISDKARNQIPGHGIRWAAPHNSFVQAGAETGLTGLIFWVSLVLANVMMPFRLARRIPKAWRKGTSDQRFLALSALYLPIAQIGFAVTAFFVSFAWLEPLYFLSALVAAFALVVRRELRSGAGAIAGGSFRSRRAQLGAVRPLDPGPGAGRNA
jgi:hypothetical protein